MAVVTEGNSEDEDADHEPVNKCLNIYKRPTVTNLNITALIFTHFTSTLIASLENVFTTYLLLANFGISDDDEEAKIASNLGFVGDLGAISTEIIIGTAFDVIGRKSVTVGGVLLVGLAMACKPLAGSLGVLYALKVASSIGIVPLMYSPYPIDYIEK